MECRMSHSYKLIFKHVNDPLSHHFPELHPGEGLFDHFLLALLNDVPLDVQEHFVLVVQLLLHFPSGLGVVRISLSLVLALALHATRRLQIVFRQLHVLVDVVCQNFGARAQVFQFSFVLLSHQFCKLTVYDLEPVWQKCKILYFCLNVIAEF